MIRTTIVSAGLAAGFALVSPIAAVAATDGTGTAPPPAKETMTLSVSGNRLTINGTCTATGVLAEAGYGVHNGHEPVQAGPMTANGYHQTITFTDVRPGTYEAYMYCHNQSDGQSLVKKFTIPAATKPARTETPTTARKAPQVAVRPQGAPETGGGPADDGTDPTGFVLGGVAVFASAGGAGFWALRRRALARR
jgi:hypothetical protein